MQPFNHRQISTSDPGTMISAECSKNPSWMISNETSSVYCTEEANSGESSGALRC